MRARDENKIEAIFQQALEMIVNEGFDGLSMQKLAKAAGVSPATIYIYFKDKEDLLLQLHKRECDKFFAYLLDDFDLDTDFASGMAVQWRRRAQYVIQNPLVAHFMEQFSFTPLHPKSMKLRDSCFKEAMHRFVKKAIADKQLMPMPIEVFWAVSYAPLYSLVKFHKTGLNMAGEPFELTDEMLTQTLALVLKALKP
jgi:TetR/AcrR family transcriptional regulator, multidrug resistance operon repressor